MKNIADSSESVPADEFLFGQDSTANLETSGHFLAQSFLIRNLGRIVLSAVITTN
jgi:hypothetical protein